MGAQSRIGLLLLRRIGRFTNVSSRDKGTDAGSGHADHKQRVLGDYIIERELGRGGMGIVWLARQQSLSRRVALKVLPNFATLDRTAVMRFRREAEAMGRLTHPGIVPIHGSGEVDGTWFFAMEFVDGPPLGSVVEKLSLRQVDKLRGSFIEEAQLAEQYPALREPAATGAGNAYVRSCARLCANVANALAAAHRQGVIHRDLKPNNILIHPAGRPVLVDFGLARDEQAIGMTRSGEQIGTPAYMAPEQARGHRDIDARTDVYGLGAVLYELLALRPPFEGRTAAEIAHRILTEEAVSVRRLNPNVPVELAAIVHRCLAKAADDRYPAIEAVELDLRSFLSGQPVTAQLPGFLARCQARLQRQRKSLIAAAGAACFATIIAVTAGFVDDRGDRADGMRTLEEAGAVLARGGDVDRARDLYERAAALSKAPARVQAQRRADFRAAFETYYNRPGGIGELRRFAVVFGEADQQKLQSLLARLEGRGRLRFASRSIEQETASIEARAVSGSGLQAEWQAVEAEQALPVGELLLRITATDGRQAFVRADVRRDAICEIAPRYLSPVELPPDFVAVADPETSQVQAMSRYEVTKREWAGWMRSLGDPVLIEEMTPMHWNGATANPEVAVRGLSFHQARTFAAAHGAHLPKAREQWLAASSGLRQLAYPWGGDLDSSRVAADRFRLSDAESVFSRGEGRSPSGVFHALGNVSEMLSGFGAELSVGGGCFLDDPAQLRLDGQAGLVLPIERLEGLRDGSAGAGLRLYRFVASPDDAAAEETAVTYREQLRQSAASCIFTDWRLRRDGTVLYQLEVRGRYDGGDLQRRLALDTAGFLQMPGTVRARDGHGRAMPGSPRPHIGAESSDFQMSLDPALRAGQGYGFFVSARLQPVEGLLPERDGYVLRLPIKRGLGTEQVFSLTLPQGFLVDSVSPPAMQWTMNGESRLCWQQADASRSEVAVVRFRADGTLGRGVSVVGAAVERSRALFAAMGRKSNRLSELLDRDFVRDPGRVGRVQALQQAGYESLELRECIDSLRVGDIETTTLLADWTMRQRDGQSFTLKGWPLVLQWRHQGDEVRAVRLRMPTQPDSGRYDGDGGYVHEGLRVRLSPMAQTTLARTQDELCPMQVRLQKGALHAQVLGHFARPDESLSSIRFRLTKGASVLRPGKLISGAAQSDVQVWQFDDGDQELWVFRQYGTRHLLIRMRDERGAWSPPSSGIADAELSPWFNEILESALVVE